MTSLSFSVSGHLISINFVHFIISVIDLVSSNETSTEGSGGGGHLAVYYTCSRSFIFLIYWLKFGDFLLDVDWLVY